MPKWRKMTQEEFDQAHNYMNEQIRQMFLQGVPPAKERTAVRREIAAAIEPLLLQHGFVKISTSFFRIHGKGLLQWLSVTYPQYETPAIHVGAVTIYDIILGDSYQGFLSSVRSNEGMAKETIENFAGIRILFPCMQNNSWLAYQKDLTEPLQKETALLLSHTLPTLDRLKTINEYWIYCNGEELDRYGYGHIAGLLLEKQYETALPLLQQYLAQEEGWREKITKEIRERIPKGLPVRCSPEQFQHEMDEKTAGIRSLIQATQEDDRTVIYEVLNRGIEDFYREMEKYSKKFIKQYPMKLFS